MNKTLGILFLTLSLFAPKAQAEPWRIVRSETPLVDHEFNDVCFASSSVIYVVGGGAVGGGPGVILKSVDGGDSWTTVYTNSERAIYACDCESSSVCYAAGDLGYVYKKEAGVETWSETTIPASSGETFNDIKVVAPSIVVAVGTNGKIVRTIDGEEWWTPAIDAAFDRSKTLESIHFSGAVGYIGGSGRTILKSMDSGASWDLIDSPGCSPGVYGNYNDVFTLDGTKLWVAVSDVCKSEDGGGGFSSSSVSLGSLSSIACIDDSNCWVASSLPGGSFRRSAIVAGALTWLSPADPALEDSLREDMTIRNSDDSTFTSIFLREIEFRGPGLGFLVGDGFIARRRIVTEGGPEARTEPPGVSLAYPDLVPIIDTLICSGDYLYIITKVKNLPEAGPVTTSMVPFTVRLESLDAPGPLGNPISGRVCEYSLDGTMAAGGIVTTFVEVACAGGSPPALLELFNPPSACNNPLILRMTVDGGGRVPEGDNEGNNVVERSAACSCAATAPAGDIPSPYPPPRPSGEKDKKKKVEKKKVEKKSKWKK